MPKPNIPVLMNTIFHNNNNQKKNNIPEGFEAVTFNGETVTFNGEIIYSRSL